MWGLWAVNMARQDDITKWRDSSFLPVARPLWTQGQEAPGNIQMCTVSHSTRGVSWDMAATAPTPRTDCTRT